MESFVYTGAVQEYVVPKTGYYTIECWGAYCKGRTWTNTTNTSCGGYTKGEILLYENEILYLYIGASGQNFNFGTQTYSNNAGGATDVRLTNGSWNDTTSLRSRIMVAGGAGTTGGMNTWNSGSPYGGYAGGLTGQQGGNINTGAGGTGGTQTTGYAFGYAGGSAPGGNGYYSGKSGYYGSGVAGGGGGSSYISGHEGCDAIDENGNHTGQPIHYSGRYFTKTVMCSGNESMPHPDGTGDVVGYTGDGVIHIDYIRDLDPRDHYIIEETSTLSNILKYKIEKAIDEESHIESIEVLLDGNVIEFVNENNEITINLYNLCFEEKEYEVLVRVNYYIVEFDIMKSYELSTNVDFVYMNFNPLSIDDEFDKIIQRIQDFKNIFNGFKYKLNDIMTDKSVTVNGDRLHDYLQALNTLDGYERTTLVDEDFFNENFSFNNYQKNTLVGYNNSLGFKFVGSGTNSSPDSLTPHFSQCLTCEFYYDLTHVKEIKYYARKVNNHGIMRVGVIPKSTVECTGIVTPEVVVYKHYNEMPTSWTQYTLNTSNLTGSYYVFFLGGYVDSTGNTTSETQYSTIEIITSPQGIELEETTDINLDENSTMCDISYAFENVKNNLFNFKSQLSNILYSKGIDVDNLSLFSLIDKTKDMKHEFTLTTDYINENGVFCNHTKSLITGYDNAAGFSITGRPGTSAGTSSTVAFRCEFVLDFTNIKKITYYAMKGANHGMLDVSISDGFINNTNIDNLSYYYRLKVHYNNFATSWTQYSIDTTDITGVRTLAFLGGWYDSTGNTGSNTRYSNITLHY